MPLIARFNDEDLRSPVPVIECDSCYGLVYQHIPSGQYVCGSSCVHCTSCRIRTMADHIAPCCSTCWECGCACLDDLPPPQSVLGNGHIGLEVESDIWLQTAFPLKFYNGKVEPDTPSRYCTPEIEIATIGPNNAANRRKIKDAVRKWGGGIVHEGTAGVSFEINPVPSKGVAFRDQISEICGALNSAGATTSSACGLHTHVDARALPMYELRKVIITWLALEEAMYSLQPVARRSNHFSEKWQGKFSEAVMARHPRIFRRSMMRTLFSRSTNRTNGEIDFRGVSGRKNATNRYYGLNLGAFWYIGTFEFRLHSGTAHADKMIAHATLCSRIIDHAVRAKESDMKLLENMAKDMDDASRSTKGMEYILNRLLPKDPMTSNYVESRRAAFNSPGVESAPWAEGGETEHIVVRGEA